MAFGATPQAATAAPPPAFEAEVYEDLHTRSVSLLLATSGGESGAKASEEEQAAYKQLRERADGLAHPFVFKGREETVDLQGLARHVQAQHPRLATEPLVRAVDEVSKALRLHQPDCCKIVERALDLPGGFSELAGNCAAMYYRECHFQALCLHDMAQSLARRPPDCRSVAFFAAIGGSKPLFEALGTLLRDLTGEKTGDPMFQAHAATMIQLLVETMLAYFFAFQATNEEAEQLLSLLPHVVTSRHAPLGQGFTVSDLDLVLREEHAEISLKLCLSLICMFSPHQGGQGQVDLTKVTDHSDPWALRLESLQAPAQDGGGGGAAVVTPALRPLGEKMRGGDYWNEESQLGQFLSFTIGGILLGDERALRSGYIHWNMIHFILYEALLSPSVLGEACTSRLVLVCIYELLTRGLLPVGRQYVAIKKLEAQAVTYRLLAPDALQISLLQALNRLCRTHPAACETFRDIAMHCTDTFHLELPQRGAGGFEGGSSGAGGFGSTFGNTFGLGRLGAGFGGAPQDAHGASTRAWLGAPPSNAGGSAMAQIQPQARYHDSTLLYAEIIDFLATLIGRGSMHCARLVCQKIFSHSNQWFNWTFLVDTLTQASRIGGQSFGGTLQRHHAAAPVPAALCHLVAAVCGTRLRVSQPLPPHPGAALGPGAQEAVGGTGPIPGFRSSAQASEALSGLLLDLAGAHPEAAVKAACLGALGHFDYSVEQAKAMLANLNAVLPTLLAGVCDVRGGGDGLLAIELLACALRLVQAIPLSKGRYALDLQPVTHVVVHHILLKVLADASQFSCMTRYWRLASLALRWFRLVLRGPMPLGSASERGGGAAAAALLEPYAEGGGDAMAADVAMRTAAGNATAFAFRCMLTLDSPVFSRVLYLTLLRGLGVPGLSEGRSGNAERLFRRQTAQVGLDLVRILLQRDALFRSLFGQQVAERAADGAAGVEMVAGGDLLDAHRPLLAEFPFPYPTELDEGSPAAAAGNPFAARRLWQSGGPTLGRSGADGGNGGAIGFRGGAGRCNPSYFVLLLEFIRVRNSPDITRSALFILTQCALREPKVVLHLLSLERWRLQCLSLDLHDLLLAPEEETPVAEVGQPLGPWNARAEARFAYEAIEMDLPAAADAPSHLGLSSHQTGLPVCSSVDAVYQLADDAQVQSADLAAWIAARPAARLLGGRVAAAGTLGLTAARATQSHAAADAGRFQAGYLRGFDVPPDWITSPAGDISGPSPPPPPALGATTCRLLALRLLAALLGGVLLEEASRAASRLAQSLLGLDPESTSAVAGGDVDLDHARLGQPSPLEAIMELLEHPPPIPRAAVHAADHGAASGARPGVSEAGMLSMSASDPQVSQATSQHATYEAALGVLAALFAAPSLRDVALRFVCHAWPSRYRILQEHLSLPWARAPAPLRRVLLSQVTLLLRLSAWEMCLVPPLGYSGARGQTQDPSGAEDTSIAGRQRLEMRRAVAGHLSEVVRSLVSCRTAGVEDATGSVDSTAPLVAAALRLADVLQLPKDEVSSGLPLHSDFQELLLASSCACLAPSDAGPLELGLDMLDPHVFLRLLGNGQRRRQLLHQQQRAASGLLDGGFEASSADVAAGGGLPAERDARLMELAALRFLAARNEASCTEYFAKSSYSAFTLFVSATFHHLAEGAGNVGGAYGRGIGHARDPRAQMIRAHLEALMPALAPEALRSAAPLALELLSALAATLVAAMQCVEGPAPSTFFYDLFRLLRNVLLHPLGTPASRRSAQRALLLLASLAPPAAPAEAGAVTGSGGGFGASALAAMAAAAAASTPLQAEGLYPSASRRLALCLNVLEAWWKDPTERRLQQVVETLANGLWGQSPAGGMTAQALAAASSAGLWRAVEQARACADALSTVFVHACDELMHLQFASPSRALGASASSRADGGAGSANSQSSLVASGAVSEPLGRAPGAALTFGSLAGASPSLEFQGSAVRFRQLLLLAEMALHLLCVQLEALVIIADATGSATTASPSPASNAPRLGVVMQYVQVFRHCSGAVGGALVPIGPGETGAAPSELNFAATLAERAERLLVQLQSL